MKRVLAVAVAVVLASLTITPAGAISTPECEDPPIIRFEDTFVGSSIVYSAADKTLTFTTEDGIELVGEKARKIGKRRILITSRSPELTVVLRADLLRGFAMASATERTVDPNVPEVQGQPRIIHQLFVPQSKGIGKCRASGPVRPPPTPLPLTTKAKTCPEYVSQAAAQQAYRSAPVGNKSLDADNDGIACEATSYENKARDETPVK